MLVVVIITLNFGGYSRGHILQELHVPLSSCKVLHFILYFKWRFILCDGILVRSLNNTLTMGNMSQFVAHLFFIYLSSSYTYVEYLWHLLKAFPNTKITAIIILLITPRLSSPAYLTKNKTLGNH